MLVQYNIEPQRWYSPNEIVDQGLLFGKSKRYIFDIIKNGTLKVTNTSSSSKPQWKVYGEDLINFIKSLENSNENNNPTNEVI